MMWEECVKTPWWWWWRLCIILCYSWQCNAVTANGRLLSQVEISCDVWHKNVNARKFIRNRLLHSLSIEKEETDYDHILLCSPDQSKLDSCFRDNQYIVCAMNRDETAHELSSSINEAMFHQFIARTRYYFNVHTFISEQIKKISLEDWTLCRHNHGYHGKADGSISDTVEMMEMKNIPSHDYIKTKFCSTLMFMIWFCIKIFDQKCSTHWSCTFGHHDDRKDHKWMALNLRLFVDVGGRMCSKTLLMMIQKTSFGTLEDAMLSLPMTCYYHRPELVWCLVQKLTM